MERPIPCEIQTERLLLRPFRPEDAEAMFAGWAADPEVTRFLTWPPHADLSVTRAVIQSWIDTGDPTWCITWKAEGVPVGSISVVQWQPEERACEIGYCIRRADWGRGCTAEAARALIAWLFAAFADLQRVLAKHDVENPRSGRVMQKAGMTFLEMRPKAARNNLGLRDMVIYQRLREDA